MGCSTSNVTEYSSKPNKINSINNNIINSTNNQVKTTEYM